VKFGAVGDLHGDFDALNRIVARHPEVSFWLCPGDLADAAGEYPRPGAPLYWIKGNNEDFDFVASQPAGSGTISHLHYIPNGVQLETNGLKLAGLGGTFAPTWYERSPADLIAAAPLRSREAPRGVGVPGSRVPRAAAARRARSGATGAGRGAPASKKDDKRRHFVHQEVDACRQLRGIDVFLSHEAPRPFLLETTGASGVARKIDAGKTPINEILKAMQPRLHLFGHHHRYSVAERQNVPSIGLDMASESYLIFDGKTLAHERMKS
jgi:Calcineurin-like phosphoesterase